MVSDNYSDIMDWKYDGVRRHNRMSDIGRAAQFAPFAALAGYDAALVEVSRTTTPRRELTDEEKLAISMKIDHALSSTRRPTVAITFFEPDSRKEGGQYTTVEGIIRKAEPWFNQLTLADGTEIALDAISDIEFLGMHRKKE